MIHHLRVSLYALMLAAAGIPLYIHLPQFASINLGMSLGTVGVILMAIRVIDLVQDPLIGCVRVFRISASSRRPLAPLRTRWLWLDG